MAIAKARADGSRTFFDESALAFALLVCGQVSAGYGVPRFDMIAA
jgi:hypothetical protein